MFAMGGPVRMEEGGIASVPQTMVARPQDRGRAPTLQPQEFYDFRRLPGGPIPGGVTYYDDPTFRPDASKLEMRAMAQFLSGTEGESPQTMFERILRLSNSELRNLKKLLWLKIG